MFKDIAADHQLGRIGWCLLAEDRRIILGNDVALFRESLSQRPLPAAVVKNAGIAAVLLDDLEDLPRPLVARCAVARVVLVQNAVLLSVVFG